MINLTKSLSVIFFMLISFSAYSQTDEKKVEDEIERLIISDSLSAAEALITKEMTRDRTSRDFVGLSGMVYWLGKIELAKNNDQSFPGAEDLMKELELASTNPKVLTNSYLAISKLYNEKGNPQIAYEMAEKSLLHAQKMNESESLANVYYYLGEYGLRSGNLNTFEANTRKAFEIISTRDDGFKISARILNYMGALMYLTGKPDSALMYYQNALDRVGLMKENSENQLYFPAAIKANMVLLKQSQNQYEEALQLARECIVLNNKFLNASKKHPLRFRSMRNLSLAYRNLASLYEQIGDYENTLLISELAYNHAKANFEPHLMEYFSAVTLLAEAKIARNDYPEALMLLAEAKGSLDSMEGDNFLLWANLYSITAGIYFGKGDYAKAKENYEKGNFYYLKAQNDALSSDYLFSEMNLALCYAHLGQKEKAYKILDSSRQRLIRQSSRENSRLINAILTTKARAADIAKDYYELRSATDYFLSHNQSDQNQAIKAYLPEMLTLYAKAKYHLASQKDVNFLMQLDTICNEALRILEERKPVFSLSENTADLMSENQEVFGFVKKINLELYEQTRNTIFLYRLLSIHESAIYNRIRSRLMLNNDLSFYNVDPEVLSREKYLRKQLAEESNTVEDFLKYSSAWDEFLDSLKISDPKYYQLRYARLSTKPDGFRDKVSYNTTVVRYFFIEEELYVYVVNEDAEKLVQLKSKGIDQLIPLTSDYRNDHKLISECLFKLYRTLWQPISNDIQTQNVIILPDEQLFNLNFELLTSEKIDSFEDLTTKSLLAQYNIAYNYSLFLLGNESPQLNYEENYLGIAPGFNMEMKQSYQRAIDDSINLDKSYFTLLPQPFSIDLVKKYANELDGRSIIFSQASKQEFSHAAKQHKVLHIGTHAESDNVNPELSRLVFAKNLSDSAKINDNHLYVHEIYDLDLSSGLTILTACETGKPGYQPGEGMISLAHAFNYSGSKSILTSLWQIDEQSSSEIIDGFYGYLSKGFRKDEALRKAKLDYLNNHRGRTLHPQYWAGLVLMGDPSPIALPHSGNWIWYSFFILLFVFGVFAFYRFRKNKAV